MREYVHEARNRRLSGTNHENGNLDGKCFDNAFVLYHVLQENGYDPQLVAGASKRYSAPVLSRKNSEELNCISELEGNVHYWVECNGKVLDVAADTFDAPGEPYIGSELPEEYLRLDDSYEYGQGMLDSDASWRRCWYCGGRTGYCGCPEERNLE